MRRDGDSLLEHVAAAREELILVAPFIKRTVLQTLLDHAGAKVAVTVATRWRPEEVAAGVSDLEVLDIVQARVGAKLVLVDNLHAKLYVADRRALTGSANLTATALGWCDQPNLEILTGAPFEEPAVQRCLQAVAAGRLATNAERDKIDEAAQLIPRVRMPLGQEARPADLGMWLPVLAAPEKLYWAYRPETRERLTQSVLESAEQDLRAIEPLINLDEKAFNAVVAEALSRAPAVAKMLDAAASDLTDAAAEALIADIAAKDISAEIRWRILRDWITYFLPDAYEIAPQSFIMRRRPGAGR